MRKKIVCETEIYLRLFLSASWITVIFPHDAVTGMVTSGALTSLTRRTPASENTLSWTASLLWQPCCSARSRHISAFLAAVVVCCQTWPTPCMFHRTHPCHVCFLRGLSAPVTASDGGCWRHAGVECGNWGPPRQMGLAFCPQMFVSEQWYGFMLMSFKRHLQWNQTARLWFTL